MTTLKDIAEHAGVSVATVSHVLGPRAHLFRPETCDKVRQVADRLGYRPNESARAVRRGQLNTLSLMLSQDSAQSGLFPPLLEGLMDAVERHAQRLHIVRMSDENLSDPEQISTLLREQSTDGLLIVYNVNIPPAFEQHLDHYKIPAVWINSRHAQNSVIPDEFAAGQQATRILLERGCKTPAFADYTFGQSPPDIHFSLQERYKGYCDVCSSHGMTPSRVDTASGINHKERIAYSMNWMRRDGRPDAIIARAASTARPILEAAKQLNIRVPEDLSIMTFSNTPLSFFGIRIDSLMVPMKNIGSLAVEALLKKISNGGEPIESVVLPMTYLPGDTIR